jgi:hypothetical protein
MLQTQIPFGNDKQRPGRLYTNSGVAPVRSAGAKEGAEEMVDDPQPFGFDCLMRVI